MSWPCERWMTGTGGSVSRGVNSTRMSWGTPLGPGREVPRQFTAVHPPSVRRSRTLAPVLLHEAATGGAGGGSLRLTVCRHTVVPLLRLRWRRDLDFGKPQGWRR